VNIIHYTLNYANYNHFFAYQIWMQLIKCLYNLSEGLICM